jgi:hypothetical protein
VRGQLGVTTGAGAAAFAEGTVGRTVTVVGLGAGSGVDEVHPTSATRAPSATPIDPTRVLDLMPPPVATVLMVQVAMRRRQDVGARAGSARRDGT